MVRMVSPLILVLLAGCVVTDLPIAQMESGPPYSGDAIAFLKEPGTKRAEVIQNLGAPTDEFTEAGVMVYTWTTIRPYGGLYLIRKHPSPVTVIEPSQTRKIWALFVAYDSTESVINHAICSFPDGSDIRSQTLNWAKLKGE
jgi:hypothetical protein